MIKPDDLLYVERGCDRLDFGDGEIWAVVKVEPGNGNEPDRLSLSHAGDRVQGRRVLLARQGGGRSFLAWNPIQGESGLVRLAPYNAQRHS